MFGYIRTFNDELKVKDLRLYKEYYCTLCKSLGSYSQVYRLLLSYDITFFLVLSGFDVSTQCECTVKTARTPKCHGSIKCFGGCCDDSRLRYISAFSIFLQHGKIMDDILDGHKKGWIIKPLLARGYKRAQKEYPLLAEMVGKHLADFHTLEKENCTDLERMEACFASIFQDAFSMLPDTAGDIKGILGEIAYHVAAWVYLLDMFDDKEKDRKEHNFNPLLQGECDPEENEIERQHRSMLLDHIEQAIALLQVLPFHDGIPIIENVLYQGTAFQMKKCGLV